MLVIGDSLHVKEMEEAERVIIKVVQSNYFNEEINCIRQGCELPRTTTKLLSLNPYLDDQGLLRVGGRISNAHVPFSAKHQIIPGKCHVAMLIIRQEHETCAHMGREYVLAAVRQKFWITNGRIIVKKVIKACFYCKKRNVEAMKPIMADLPEFRVEDSQPIFSNTGVDLFGPIYIKQRRARLKRWGSLFTCLDTRAVHLEVVESLETDSFINCLRRFTSRRGQPKLIISDCGSNFKGSANELKENLQALDQDKLSHYAQTKRFEWKFIPPSSPRMGGAWERVVRTVKTALTTIMKDRVLTDFQLATIFCEVEYILNSRPLTCVSDDPNDYEALTPNHFLLGKSWNSPISKVCESDLCSKKRWRQVQILVDHFWTRWKREYLPTLTVRRKWQTNQKNLKEGDLVLLDDSTQRSHWLLARIQRVIQGKDGVVRVVQIKTPNGVYTRPTAKLHLLKEET